MSCPYPGGMTYHPAHTLTCAGCVSYQPRACWSCVYCPFCTCAPFRSCHMMGPLPPAATHAGLPYASYPGRLVMCLSTRYARSPLGLKPNQHVVTQLRWSLYRHLPCSPRARHPGSPVSSFPCGNTPPLRLYHAVSTYPLHLRLCWCPLLDRPPVMRRGPRSSTPVSPVLCVVVRLELRASLSQNMHFAESIRTIGSEVFLALFRSYRITDSYYVS